MNISKELARIAEENRRKYAKEEVVVVEEMESDFGIEELPDEILEDDAMYDTSSGINLGKGENS